MSTNVPVTVWRDTDGQSEYSFEGKDYIVDTLSFYLVDTSGFYVTDTGVIATSTPSTTWEEDNSI